MIKKPRSVYQRGAQDGLLMGPLLAATVVLFGATPFYSWLFFPTILCISIVPMLAYRMLKNSYAEDYQCSTFSMLWLHGICIFFFGGAIMAVVTYVAMRWVWPDYIYNMVQLCIEALQLSPTPEAETWIKVFEKAIEDNTLPKISDIVVELVYLSVLSGSFLSMFLSMVIRSTNRRTTPPPIDK